MNRSGTTLLRMMLDAHPRAHDPARDPLRPRPDQGRARGRRDARERARGDEVGARVGRLRLLRRGDAGPPAGARRGSSPARPCAPSTRPTSEQQGKPRWGEKTPTYVQKMKLIQRALPEARFVHVIRDGRDVALSVLDRTVRDLTAARHRQALAEEDHQGARGLAEARPLHRDPLRGPDPRHRAGPAPGLRVHRAALGRRDARLPRALGRAAAGDGAGAARRRPREGAQRRAPDGDPRDDDQAAERRPRRPLAHPDDAPSSAPSSRRSPASCSPSSATRSAPTRSRARHGADRSRVGGPPCA